MKKRYKTNKGTEWREKEAKNKRLNGNINCKQTIKATQETEEKDQGRGKHREEQEQGKNTGAKLPNKTLKIHMSDGTAEQSE